MPLSPETDLIEGASVKAVFSWVGPDLKRLVRLVRREGMAAAWHKGVRYLRWRIPVEIVRFRMLRLARVEDRFTLI